MKKKNIIIVSDYSSLYGGNFVASLVALHRELLKKDYNAILVFPKEVETREWFLGLKNKSIQTNTVVFSGTYGLIKQLAALIKENQAEKIYFHFGHVLAAECISVFFPNIDVYIHIHSDFSLGKKNYKAILRNIFLFKHCLLPVKFICVSETMSKELGKKCYYVPNGFAPERMSIEQISGDDFRKYNNIDKDVYLCEIFGWSPSVKGVDIAVSAVSKIYKTTNTKIMLAIICGRNTSETEMKRFIQKHTECSGEEPFLRYFAPNEDVFRFHSASNVHLSTSRSEGFSYSILEMLSIGKKCVISDIPGVKWAKKYDSVLSFESENIDACADVIIKSINLPEENENVKKEVLRDYSIGLWTERIINVLLQ